MSKGWLRSVLRRMALMAGCLLTAVAARADGTAGAAEALARQGFEDVRLLQVGDTVYCTLEPTAYRGTVRGAAVAISQIAQLLPAATAIELAVSEYRSPQVAIHARREGGSWSATADYATRAVAAAVAGSVAVNRSAGRVDVRVHPMVSLDNHRFDRLFEYIVSIAPAVELTLWPGSRLTLQPVFPVATNVWHDKADAFVRVGTAALQQELRLTERLRATVSGGMFLGNVSGLDARLNYRATQRLTVELHASLTGDAYAESGGYHFDRPDRVSLLARATYYHPATRMEGGITGGRFMYGDYGARLDLTRHFGEYAIGVFGILTGGEHNAGFHFAIPLGGKSQRRRGPLRLMLPEYFDWEYNMVSYYEYADERMGIENEARPDVNHSAHYWQAAYVEQYLRKYLSGEMR